MNEVDVVHQLKSVERGVVTTKCGLSSGKNGLINRSSWSSDITCPACKGESSGA